MRLLKPSWVTLDDKPIFSIDIHPDGSRFATGGQGDDCGKVVIWNMAPVRDEKFEKDDTVPRILCQMDNHLGCVNCVRWSHSGKHLASGGDDKLVMIWQTSRYGGPSTVFGSGGKMVNIEQWRPVSTLRGHTGDVLDLAWSPHDAWLATCSVDNTVVVWNALKFPEQICVLKGHSGLVKGVTWDPVGKYLASQSDDKSLRIWRTMDWQQEAVVTEPFQECSATTHILRLNWSPDGHYVVSAHAMNNSGPTAQIIERDGWKTSMDFVGHRKAITVVRFNPNILSMKVKKELDKPQQYTCCAIGSRDRSLSIWLTALKRPLVVTHDLFTNSILDISWSKCGMELLCCSWDGTVAFIDFTAEEIGNPLSRQEVRNLHERIYGKSLALSNLVNPSSQIIESGAVLNLRQQQAKEAAERNAQKQNQPLLNGKTPFKARKLDRICEPTDKQIETRTADGRRRITPIYLAPQPDMGQGCDNGDVPPYDHCSNSELRKNSMDSQANDIPLPFSTKNITFTSSTEQSKIVIEKQDRVTGPGISQSSSRSNSEHSLPTTTHTTPSANTASESRDAKPKSGNETPQPAEVLETDKIADNSKISEKEKFNEKITEKAKAAMERHAVIDDKKNRLKPTLPVKRKLEGTGRVGRPRKYPLLNQTIVQSPSTTLNAKEDSSRSVRFDADVHLPQITIQKSFSKQIAGRLADHNAVILEVENNVHVGMVTVHKVKCSNGGGPSWEQVLTSRVLLVAGSKYLVCIACEDKSVTFFTSGGRKVFPSLILNAKVFTLDCNGYYIMAITQKGRLYVWNMQKKCSIIKNETLNIIMSESDSIVKAQITKEGVPIISLSNNKSYSFSPDFGSWIWVTSRVDPLQKQSDHHSCIPVSEGSKVVGTLASLQASQEKLSQIAKIQKHLIRNQLSQQQENIFAEMYRRKKLYPQVVGSGSQASRMYRSANSIHQSSTLSHLANQVAACLALKSSTEYKFWLLTYIRYLVQEGIEPKLREICDELLGPGYVKNRKDNWDEHIVGLRKRDILAEILPIIGSNLSFQRLFTEYQDQLLTLQK